MAELFRLEAPEVPRAPVLICAIDSWIDAGLAAARARAELVSAGVLSVIGRFDAESLVDHQARRPVMHIVDGVNTGLDYPEIVLHLGDDADGRRFLLLTGAEPDRRWRTMSRTVAELAHQAGVRLVLTLGAYPAAVPHSRPAKVVATASDQELANRVGFLPAQLDVPAGFNAAVEVAAAEATIPAVGLWAQVPHYVANLPYPAAALALLQQVRTLAELRVELDGLERAAADTRARLDGLVASNPEHVAMVRQLEVAYDEQAAPFPLPTGDELAAEVEQFLRNQDD